MKYLGDAARHIIVISSLLLLIAFYFSFDRYHKTYLAWNQILTELKLASFRLDKANAEVLSGYRIDYDELTRETGAIEQLVRSLETIEQQGIQTHGVLYISSALAAKHRRVEALTRSLHPLFAERNRKMENYKSRFSVLRNSEVIVLQLLGDLQLIALSNNDLFRETAELELELLRQFKSVGAMVNSRKLMQKVAAMQQRYGNADEQLVDSLRFIALHLAMIADKQPAIRSLVQAELALSSDLQQGLADIERELTLVAEGERDRSLIFTYLLGVLATVMLPFCISQARYLYLQACTITRHNEELEALVTRRTKHLEAATDSLMLETAEREKTMEQLMGSQQKLDSLINGINGCVYEFDCINNVMTYVSQGVEAIWGHSLEHAAHADLWSKIHPDDETRHREAFASLRRSQEILNIEYRICRSESEVLWVRDVATPVVEKGRLQKIVGVVSDISEFKLASEVRARMEEELSHAQKLESVGQLAAGIAHEINTPAQFIADNLSFLEDSVKELFEMVSAVDATLSSEKPDTICTQVKALIADADLEYLSEEVPAALRQSSEGIARVATIVRAMKDYSHPGATMQLADINAALKSTVTVSSGEWKYCAKLSTELDEELPLVECVVSDVNQVVLNMIVNATHAIVDRFEDSETTAGEITITSRFYNGQAVIEVGDNGSGMTSEVRSRVFEQFFTTKAVGKGTGQGLSIAHRLIVGKHHGAIEIDSEPGVGTVFRIILPIQQPHEDDLSADEITQAKVAEKPRKTA